MDDMQYADATRRIPVEIIYFQRHSPHGATDSTLPPQSTFHIHVTWWLGVG